jgi:hypothetical protein
VKELHIPSVILPTIQTRLSSGTALKRRSPIVPAPAPPPDVQAVFESYPAPVRARLLEVRAMIFALAENTAGVGKLTEALRWGEPAYLTGQSKSGSTIRLAHPETGSDVCGVMFNCQTSLVDTFRSRFPDELTYATNRAILLETVGPLPTFPLQVCLSLALTYHLDKRSGRAAL